jgi:hypothetical protein
MLASTTTAIALRTISINVFCILPSFIGFCKSNSNFTI